MGLFDKFFKTKGEAEVKDTGKATPPAGERPNEPLNVEHLKPWAGRIIEMLKAQLNNDEIIVLLFASGLAGIACHEAVKATNGSFAVVETKDGKKYYFGDDVNKFLLEDKYSVYAFCSALSPIPEEILQKIIGRFANSVGNPNFKLWDTFALEDAYQQVRACWDGIFNNLIGPACKSPAEWPILLGIVVQNIIIWGSSKQPQKRLISMTVECSNALSKMDKDSF